MAVETFMGAAQFIEQSIASAATTNLGGVTAVKAAITGTTTITSFGSSAYLLRFIRFTGALTLTYNATSLILPGSANITTAAGDTCIAMSDASGNWTVYNYQRRAVLAGSTDIPVADGGTGASTAIAAAQNMKTGYTLGNGQAAAHTGDTAQHTFATVSLPANALGANGTLCIDAIWEYTGTNSKTSRIWLGGTGGTAYLARATTTTLSWPTRTLIQARNATNSQVGGDAGPNNSYAQSGNAVVTSALDTTGALDIVFTGQLTNSGESIRLASYLIQLFWAQ